MCTNQHDSWSALPITKLSLVTSPNVSFPSKQRRALMDTEEEAGNREQLLQSFVPDEKRYWWRSRKHNVPVQALRKHAVRRKTWFRGTISLWCWANIHSYLQQARTESSPDIDFSAQTLDKHSLCDLQITVKKKKTPVHDTWWTGSVSTGIKKKK